MQRLGGPRRPSKIFDEDAPAFVEDLANRSPWVLGGMGRDGRAEAFDVSHAGEWVEELAVRFLRLENVIFKGDFLVWAELYW